MKRPFEPDLSRASTPPPGVYTDPEILALERRQIFWRTWQPAGRSDLLRDHGQTVATELIGEPIVLVRDGEALRGFHNICRHRSGPVAEGCARRTSLQCKYHGWTYSLAGALLRAPEMEGVCDFDAAAVHLAPVQVSALGPLAFVNACLQAEPLATTIEDILARMPELASPGQRHVLHKEWIIGCNWKVYVENYLEGYHLPLVHPGLYRELDYDQYRVETGRRTSFQYAPLRPNDGTAPRRYGARGSTTANYAWLFPNVMFNSYEDQLQVNWVVPLGPETTRVDFDWYLPASRDLAPDDQSWARLVEFSDHIQNEDVRICEAVQKNLRSPWATSGRYSVRRENGVHHFHRLLDEFLRDPRRDQDAE